MLSGELCIVLDGAGLLQHSQVFKGALHAVRADAQLHVTSGWVVVFLRKEWLLLTVNTLAACAAAESRVVQLVYA